MRTYSVSFAALMIVACLLSASAFVGNGEFRANEPVDQAAAKTKAVDHLSYTKFGWRNIEYWKPQKPSPVRMEFLHPITIGGLMVLLSLGLATWSSSETDWQEPNASRAAKKLD